MKHSMQQHSTTHKNNNMSVERQGTRNIEHDVFIRLFGIRFGITGVRIKHVTRIRDL